MSRKAECQETEGRTEPRRRGRPRGAKTAERAIVLVRPAACPACGSTSRTPYRLVFTRAQPGTIADQPYTHIAYRDCKCVSCGRPRREAHFERLEAPLD
jgi:hypothetical protein